MRKSIVKVISETKTVLNSIVSIDGVNYTNLQAYKMAKNGEIYGYCGVKNKDGTKYIRSNYDNCMSNNFG